MTSLAKIEREEEKFRKEDNRIMNEINKLLMERGWNII
jgi:hypothetical protein